MDILNRKILRAGETAYFFVSSVQEPFIYLRFKGIVKTVKRVYESQVIYLIDVTEVLESQERIHAFINSHKYKIFSVKEKKSKNKKLYTFDYDFKSASLVLFLRKRQYLFESSSAITFLSHDEMQAEFARVNIDISKHLKKTLRDIHNI